jgi:hypothetical protein
MVSYSTTREHSRVAATHESPADLHAQGLIVVTRHRLGKRGAVL